MKYSQITCESADENLRKFNFSYFGNIINEKTEFIKILDHKDFKQLHLAQMILHCIVFL